MDWVFFFCGLFAGLGFAVVMFTIAPELAEELHQRFQKWLADR